MNRLKPFHRRFERETIGRQARWFPDRGRLTVWWMLAGWLLAAGRLAAAESDMAAGAPAPDAGLPPHFNIREYVVRGYAPLSSNTVDALLTPHTGTNVDLEEIVRAAADLQSEYVRHGYPATGVGIAEGQITNGIVTMNVFQSAVPQIVVSGRSFLVSSNLSGVSPKLLSAGPAPKSSAPPAVAVTNAVSLFPPAHLPPPPPAGPEEMARARAALERAMADLTAKEKDTRIHVVSTNAGSQFDVENYLILGNSVLPPGVIGKTLTNIDGAFGTNVCLDGIRTVVEQLQIAYHDRGYVTVAVGLPQQKLTNATVNVQVTEGRLAAINVAGNRFFSSNNVMRALPSLHTNMILNGLVFQSELNRANANQDRQIYLPVIGPGPDPGTSELTLKVKDRLPLHAKVELNNEGSPGTPGLRVNSSAAYNNLWQLEHSLGVQYGFSPEAYKVPNQMDFYDQPLVAYYSGFYRLPLGYPESVESTLSSNPNNFGYNEATHQFKLPPPSGQPELTLYASRSTIDPGVQMLSSSIIYDVPGVRQVSQAVVQQDLTINQAMGFRLNKPLPEISGIRSTVSGGMDFKTYELTDYKTNIFSFLEITRRSDGSLNPPVVSSVSSPVPVTLKNLEYLPLTLHYDATARGVWGTATLGLGISGNAWYSGSITNVTGSTESSGHWVTLDPSLSWNIPLHRDWLLMINANGQWASEPLLNTEQFSAGGVNSVRGYQEGELFGDDGWRVSVEQQTPRHIVGMVHGNVPLAIRGSVYTDYARILLIDPQGRPNASSLWGAGVGATASAGSHWEAKFLCSLPLINAGTTTALEPFFNFELIAQF